MVKQNEMDACEDYLFDDFYLLNDLMTLNQEKNIIADNNSKNNDNTNLNFELNKEEWDEYEIEEERCNEDI